MNCNKIINLLLFISALLVEWYSQFGVCINKNALLVCNFFFVSITVFIFHICRNFDKLFDS